MKHAEEPPTWEDALDQIEEAPVFVESEPGDYMALAGRQSEVLKLAKEVLQGHHGRGEARMAALGDMYVPVMEEVLRIRMQGGAQ